MHPLVYELETLCSRGDVTMQVDYGGLGGDYTWNVVVGINGRVVARRVDSELARALDAVHQSLISDGLLVQVSGR